MPQLDELIGQQVIVAILGSEKGYYRVTLTGVEAGGVWVHSDELQRMAKKAFRAGRGEAPVKTAYFLPFCQIQFLLAPSVDLGET